MAPMSDAALAPWTPLRFDVTARPTEPNWLVDGLMARGTITMLSGDTSAGKSFVALALAMAVIEGGREWLGQPVSGPGRVLIVENEMPSYDVERRLRGFGIRDEHWRRLAYLDKSQAVALDDPQQARQLMRVVERFAPDLVILDTLFSLVPTIDHNSGGVAATCYRDVLRPLARSTSLLLLHHENKPGINGRGRPEFAATGSRAWAHQADRHLTLAAVGDKEVKFETMRDGRTLGSYALELDGGKTRGALKPRLSLSIETEEVNGQVISTEVRVTGERRRQTAEDATAKLVLAFLANRQNARLADLADSLGVKNNDGRLKRALDSLIEGNRVRKSGYGVYEIAR
jgi:AAA domain